MKKQKIYLETTLFNYYLDGDRDAHADTVRLFGEIRAGKYEAYTSETVTDELDKAPSPKREMMSDLIKRYGITTLALNDIIDELADLYIENKIIPKKYRTDGVHIAYAVVNKLDCIISMNLRHIVKDKVKKLVNAANILRGYKPIEIISPKDMDKII